MTVKGSGWVSVLAVFVLSGCGTTASTSSVSHVGAAWSPVKVTQRDLMPAQAEGCLAVLSVSECKHAKHQSMQQMREAALDNLSDNFLNSNARPGRIKQSRMRLKRDRVEWQYKF